MRSPRVYRLRQLILEAFKDAAPQPMTLDDVLDYPDFGVIKPTRQEILEEWNGLIIKEYLKIIPESDGDYCEITAAGLTQINREGKRELYIWGKWGL